MRPGLLEGAPPLGIQVRAGLHTGEVEGSESDIHGIAVHLAARIMDEAAAGEVVVSQ
jgi:class 3 adenylate cyclase